MDKIFTPDIKAQADELVAKYETRQASILMILRLLQEKYGSITDDVRKAVAEYLGLPEVDVHGRIVDEIVA